MIGPKVFQLLHKTLQPTRLNSENSWHVKKCSSHEHEDPVESEKTSIFDEGHQIFSSAVLSLVVKDPRILTKKGDAVVPDVKYLGLLGNEEFQSKGQTVSSLPKHEAELLHEYGDLWDASKGVDPPVEESILCAEKHHQRKELFCVSHKGSGSHKATLDKIYTRSCPVLLLKNGNFKDSVTWCSLILPLSWVKAFWITFVSNGAHAIGLREKHWVAGEIGLPYFPLDFPECSAYSHFMAMEAASVNHKAMLVPPSKRPPKVPIPPPWDCVLHNFGKRCEVGNIQAETLGTQDEKIDDMEKSSGSEKSHDRISDCQGTPFEGIVARTSCMLNDFLNNISGDCLLFPRIAGQENCLHKSMRNKDFLKQDIVMSEIKCGKTPCFVRVLLHALKEGVFEQGAVVCAPLAADIMSWTMSSESNDQQFQIAQSSVVSYFMQLPSGKWELRMPEDQALSDSHRWTIGFVTTGFVRGSKKAMAGALCEASLLSRLREEQWTALPVKRRRKEIYVLVRNMRSTAYRLARATIVLEQQEQDVNFM